MAGQPQTVYAADLARAERVATDLQALAAQDPARARTAAAPLPDLDAIEASIGVADWGVAQPIGGT